jgi:hypothetical protein
MTAVVNVTELEDVELGDVSIEPLHQQPGTISLSVARDEGRKADLFQTDCRVLQERAGSLPSWALRKSACQRQFAENRAIV